MNYLLLAATATALFFAAYWLLMRREKRHQMVRFYLMGTLVLAFLLPAVHLHIAVPHQYVMSEGATGIFPTLTYQTVQTSPIGQTSPIQQADINWLFWLWLAGAVAATAVLLVRLVSLWRRMRGLPFEERDGVKVALVDDNTPAFSFGHRIVVGTRGFSEAEVQQLVGHERVHVRQRHTADIMLCELAKVVLWFDPFIYLYARELKRVHEYIADSEMMSADYAELFYHQVSGRCYSPLAHSFDYRMVHQRIAMMSQRRNHSGWLKPLAALPMAVAVLLAGCTPKSNNLLVGQWEYASGTTEHIYHGNSPYPDFTVDMAEEHILDEIDFRTDGTATVMAWNNTTENHKFVYEPCAVEWQMVGDSLLLRNERGEEVWHIQQLDSDTLVFVYSSIFTYYGGDGHQRDTYTYRRKK
ncbi:MAG: hypothetical protein IKC19_04690 [Bacteroidales bacterium]|nr:hypothetical protein [Bacteroidales bacterium]